jgi:hypothetical protein
MQEASVVSGCFLISSGDPPVMLDPTEEPLDLISVCIQVAIDVPLDESVFPRWNYNNRLQRLDLLDEVVAVEAFISDQSPESIALD